MNWGQMFKNWGQLGSYAARGGLGRTATGAIYGGLAGGLYGALSRNTSVLGGAMTGMTLGAGGARYGGAGLLADKSAGIGLRSYGKAFGGGMIQQMRTDYHGARMMANQGFSKIQGMTTNWGINHIFSKFGG